MERSRANAAFIERLLCFCADYLGKEVTDRSWHFNESGFPKLRPAVTFSVLTKTYIKPVTFLLLTGKAIRSMLPASSLRFRIQMFSIFD
jgi:hypothetical protein